MPDVQRPIDNWRHTGNGQLTARVPHNANDNPANVPPRSSGDRGTPPRNQFEALRRGFFCRCPACGGARLFMAFLKPFPYCPGCGQDWSHQRADDFPPYLVILVLGHLIVPSMAAVGVAFHPPLWVLFAIWLPLTVVLAVVLLQPAKGAVIAYQWWHGIGGFEERLNIKPPSGSK